jgi:amino acid permease
MSKLLAKKSINVLLQEANDSETTLKRTLSSGALVALGIGAIIGAGIICAYSCCCCTKCWTICNHVVISWLQ